MSDDPIYTKGEGDFLTQEELIRAAGGGKSNNTTAGADGEEGTEDASSKESGSQSLAPTGGLRTGKVDEIESICQTTLTSEPYIGHATADAVVDSAKKPAQDPSVEESLNPASSSNEGGKPDDFQTTEGCNVAVGFEINGVIVKASEVVQSATGTATGIVDVANGMVQDPGGAAAGVLDSALGGNPVYDEALGILNNFNTMNASKLVEIMGLGGMIAGIKAALPPIRFPTSNALMEKIIGLQKELSALQAQLNQFGLDKLGFDLDLLSADMQNMKGLINDAIAVAKDGQDLINILKENGITMPVDGERIFEDAFGNKLVDFSAGLGPVGATLGLITDMNKTYSTIADDIDVPLHENGRLAITSFAQSVGPEVFAGSRVRDFLNAGRNDLVGREMQKWVLDKPGGTVDPVLVGRRQYESQFFQTPDEMDINFGELADGGTTWAELAYMLKRQREEFYVKKTSEDGPADS
tara:strand:+ start:5671 stop:7074 length:1404 start_codon:yes stop_codon:yes gene_type:complete